MASSNGAESGAISGTKTTPAWRGPGTQVLLVTHSPQVAARAARHFRITRKRDVTRVEELSADERIEEIARMLSGTAVTEEARAAARRLLDEAQTQSAPKKRVRA